MILINKGGALSLAVYVHWERSRGWTLWRREASIFNDFSLCLNMGADRDTDKAALGKHSRPQREKESIRVRRESRCHLKRVDSGGGDHLQQ